MKVFLTAVDDELAAAWTRHCGDLDSVEVVKGSILDLAVQAVVSPANSFGFMDGGVDGVYLNHFGRSIQARLQEIIRDRHHGELLVGSADIIETGDTAIPFLIAAPTMRVPMVLKDSVNPYLAARAVFLLLKHGCFAAGSLKGQMIASHVESVAFPGLATGIGRVGPNTCARQVRAAYDEVMLGKSSYPRSWAEASEKHQLLYSDKARNLQRD